MPPQDWYGKKPNGIFFFFFFLNVNASSMKTLYQLIVSHVHTVW